MLTMFANCSHNHSFNNKYKLNDNTTFEFNVISVDSLSLNNSGYAAEELYTKILANIENGGDFRKENECIFWGWA